MKEYIVLNMNGHLVSSGRCPNRDFDKQADKKKNETVIEGFIDQRKQKIVGGKVVNKTAAEIEADNPAPPEIPESQRSANITNEQWQGILNRLDNLEAK